MAVILPPPHRCRLDTYQAEHQQRNIAALLRELLYTPFYHVDESVKSHPSKSRGVIAGVLTMFTWKDTVNPTATHYCAFAEHGAAYGY